MTYDHLNKLEPLIEWLKKQDPAKEYSYIHGNCCLVAQYLRDSGVCVYSVDPFRVRLSFGTSFALNPILDSVSHRAPWTMGAALSRAEEALVEGHT